MDTDPAIIELQSGKPADIVYRPDLRAGVIAAVESWKAFCALPKETKQRFTYTEDQGALDGSGYEIKEQKGSSLDLKENFHVTLRESERLTKLTQGVEVVQATRFIDDAEKLIKLATPIIQEFARGLGQALSLPTLEAEVMSGQQSWIFRYIHYFGGRSVGDQTATPHADKSGFTLHLFESGPGLEYLGFDKQWRPMPVSDGQTAIISGMQLQFASENKIKALCHRVVATNESAVSGRYSVVCFIPLVNTKAYNKNGAGRLQEFAPGFNYEMPLAEFQKLFV
ncbi:MAG TPA: 2OG-Fe(II) oxygenase family protein [Candidatus Paceibacterota bacterium]|nr:2OG-Fe(II) oxygenase family protein [Candidatus Paceibacterota bacterium]